MTKRAFIILSIIVAFGTVSGSAIAMRGEKPAKVRDTEVHGTKDPFNFDAATRIVLDCNECDDGVHDWRRYRNAAWNHFVTHPDLKLERTCRGQREWVTYQVIGHRRGAGTINRVVPVTFTCAYTGDGQTITVGPFSTTVATGDHEGYFGVVRVPNGCEEIWKRHQGTTANADDQLPVTPPNLPYPEELPPLPGEEAPTPITAVVFPWGNEPAECVPIANLQDKLWCAYDNGFVCSCGEEAGGVSTCVLPAHVGLPIP